MEWSYACKTFMVVLWVWVCACAYALMHVHACFDVCILSAISSIHMKLGLSWVWMPWYRRKLHCPVFSLLRLVVTSWWMHVGWEHHQHNLTWVLKSCMTDCVQTALLITTISSEVLILYDLTYCVVFYIKCFYIQPFPADLLTESLPNSQSLNLFILVITKCVTVSLPVQHYNQMYKCVCHIDY